MVAAELATGEEAMATSEGSSAAEAPSEITGRLSALPLRGTARESCDGYLCRLPGFFT
jgi:hypothetical protein